MALTPEEVSLIDHLHRKLQDTETGDELLLRYYQGRQRFEQIGLTIPPELRKFTVIVNWPRTVVDTINDRQQVRSLILPGEETADPKLQAIWDASNMSAHLRMFNRDRMIYGRSYLSVGSNEADPSLPLVRVESPREMVAEVDVRREVITSAARFYGVDSVTGVGPTNVTLYLPNMTIWVARRDSGKWSEVDRDRHNLGAVPVVMHLNRRMSSGWYGESEMADIIPITDAAARSMTDMQFAQAAHGAPRMWMTGVAQGDFMGKDGKPIPKVEAYFNAVTTIKDPQGKVGQLDAADLKNFETAMNVYGNQASVVTGFPGRYFGNQTVNPPGEGAVIADEINLVRSVESQNDEVGMTLGWTAGLALRFATGEWVEGNRVRVDWHNPATPTLAQQMDATVKAFQAGIVSREGAWDELGWSEAKKAKQRAYFEAEASDPAMERMVNTLMRSTATEVNDDGTGSGL